MHTSKDSMWREIWKILQNFLGTKQGLITAVVLGLTSSTGVKYVTLMAPARMPPSMHEWGSRRGRDPPWRGWTVIKCREKARERKKGRRRATPFDQDKGCWCSVWLNQTQFPVTYYIQHHLNTDLVHTNRFFFFSFLFENHLRKAGKHTTTLKMAHHGLHIAWLQFSVDYMFFLQSLWSERLRSQWPAPVKFSFPWKRAAWPGLFFGGHALKPGRPAPTLALTAALWAVPCSS